MNTRSQSRGVSLIELMVSILIGLFLVIGATTVYVNSRKTADDDEAIARLSETARYAISILEPDIRMANYWGLQKSGTAFANKPAQIGATNPSPALVASTHGVDCGATHAIDIENYIAATNNNYGLSCAAKSTTGGAMPSADTLTIRHAAAPIATLDASTLQLCSSRNYGEIIKGSTCGDEIHDLKVNTYYVAQQSDNNASSPALRRKALIKGPDFQDVEIIPGVEDMQIQLGWDSSGETGQATRYLNPENAALAGGQIVAVRVWMLIRAERPDAAYTDTQTYEYGDRDKGNGVVADLSAASAATMAYKPNDHYRRLLVSRTLFLRNTLGT